MAIAAVATVFFGFAPTYYLKSFTHTAVYPTGLPVSPSLPALVHVHALVFTAWILLFLVQTTLIAADRPTCTGGSVSREPCSRPSWSSWE